MLTQLLVMAAAASTVAAGPPPSLPKDIDARSLSRLAPVDPDTLNEADKKVYDGIRRTAPTIPLSGPAPVSMYSPGAAGPIDALNQYLRKTVVGPRYFELAALSTAREFDQAFEWTGHEPAGRRAGLEDATLDVIKFNRPVTGLPEKDATVILMERALLRDHKVSSALWAKSVELFGKQGTIEIVTIIGDYVLAGVLLTAADQHLPADRPSTLPPK